MSRNSDKAISKDLEIDTIFIDRKNYPDLFIEPIPESKFSFINEWGEEDSCEQNHKNNLPYKWVEIERVKGEYYFYLWHGPGGGGVNKLIFCNNDFYDIINSGDHPGREPIIDFIKTSDREFSYVVNTKYHNIEYDIKQTISQGYLKINTVMPKTRLIGYVNVKQKKIDGMILNIPIKGKIYQFQW